MVPDISTHEEHRKLCHFTRNICACDGPTLSSDLPYPWGTGRAELPDPEVLGQEPILKNFWVKTGRKGTLRSDPGKQVEKPGKNGTPKERTATSGTEEKTRMDPQTAQEQEDIGATSRHLKEGRTRRQYFTTTAMLWEECGLRRCVGRGKQDQRGGREARREGKM
ncbi:hypothetical protein NDU88_005275 [Pleurodeles waltl]|uniref:Uncharacterized protein n=1 Tax=Pleurodeles waltl TaxID=8319 RepID=A0AAV7WUA1_PLEWA|nr:hypothetical protein NDU88_005275 [Pleurodeles waltl]